MALAGNGRWCYLDPKLGAMHAVAEAARKVACTGATPVAATNCLNFGNPMKPEIMAQLSQAIDGISEACTALGTPITGGNVSLYNETKGEGIYPTPVIGVVGILDDVSKAVPSGFQAAGDTILYLFPVGDVPSYGSRTNEEIERSAMQRFGTSEYARAVLGTMWGTLPEIDLAAASRLNLALARLAQEGLMKSCADEGSGGIAVTLAKCGIANNLGAEFEGSFELPSYLDALEYFSESAGCVVVTCSPEDVPTIVQIVRDLGAGCQELGKVQAGTIQSRHVRRGDTPDIYLDLDRARTTFSSALEEELEAQVVLA